MIGYIYIDMPMSFAEYQYAQSEKMNVNICMHIQVLNRK